MNTLVIIVQIYILYSFIYYFWLCWVFVAGSLWKGSSLAVASGDYSLTVLELLIAVASLVEEHRLSSCGARLSCPTACGIFSDQGSNLSLLHWQADSLPLSYEGSHKYI